MDRAHLPPALERRTEAPDPAFARLGVHPVDPADDRRVVHEHQRRRVGRLVEPRAEPGLPRLAERPAVAAGLEGVEQQEPEAVLLEHVMEEPALGRPHLRERVQEPFAAVVVADHRPDGERAVG